MPKLYPTEREIRAALIRRVAEFIKLAGTNKSSFGKAAVSDPAFVGRVGAGGNFTISTYGRAMTYIRKHQPRRK